MQKQKRKKQIINTLNFKIMKKYLFIATAFAALASCSTNDYVGDQALADANNGQAAITFNSGSQAITRASGADAASSLGSQFIVWGEKNESSGTAPATGNLVFPNYQVNYKSSTAHSTTSNTNDWEYVGVKHTNAYATNIKIGGTATTENDQTIKYWDNAATNYVFTAISAKKEDITNARVVINKTTSGTKKYDKGYTITLAKTAGSPDVYPDLSKIYFADRIEKTSSPYSGPVQFQFRNAVSQVRAGIYETVPGYGVSSVKFYVTGDTEAKVSETSAFGAKVPNVTTSNYEGTLTVTYYDNSAAAIENQPKLTVSKTPSNDLILGTNMSTLSTSSLMGTASTAPTWDTSAGAYTSVLPQIANSTDMTLKVDYTLYNDVTKETTNITGKTVTVPAKYAQWKPNYKYTYLFKITDSDLTPITFDALVVDAGDGIQETITTVDDPSITTYQKGAVITSNNEYSAGTIYVVVGDGTTTLTAENAKLYTATIEDGAAQGITEATVANAIANATPSGDPQKWVVTDANGKKLTVTAASGLETITEIPAADAPDGVAIAIKGVKFTATASTTYVFEYTDGSSNKHYKVIKVQ